MLKSKNNYEYTLWYSICPNMMDRRCNNSIIIWHNADNADLQTLLSIACASAVFAKQFVSFVAWVLLFTSFCASHYCSHFRKSEMIEYTKCYSIMFSPTDKRCQLYTVCTFKCITQVKQWWLKSDACLQRFTPLQPWHHHNCFATFSRFTSSETVLSVCNVLV